MFKYNKDWTERDMILFGEVNRDKYWGGIRHFETDYETLQKLVDLGYADPEESHNDAPCIKDILEFLEKYPGFIAHGYAVSPDRDDYRISIEGVDGRECIVDYSFEMLNDFVDMFRFADEFSLEFLYCWFD